MSEPIIEEESISLPFVVKDTTGAVVFRSALIFPNVTELRNTSSAEREVMQQEQYQAHLDVIANPPAPEDEQGEGA